MPIWVLRAHSPRGEVLFTNDQMRALFAAVRRNGHTAIWQENGDLIVPNLTAQEIVEAEQALIALTGRPVERTIWG